MKQFTQINRFLRVGCLAGVLMLPLVAYAQYTADSKTNIYDGTVTYPSTNWGGNYIVGSNTAFDVLLVNSGGGLTNAAGYIGYETAASNNLAVVSGSGALWTNTGTFFYVGNSGAGNRLIITNGGRVVNAGGEVGAVAGSINNVVLVSDANSLWRNTGNLRVGDAGAGNQLIITNGGQVVNAIGTVGQGAGNNVVLVSGSGSLWTNTSAVYVGNLAAGTGNRLIITDSGRVVNVAGNVGTAAGSSNNVVLVSGGGSLWRNTGSLSVGSAGASNQLIIADGGGVVSAGGSVGNAASASSNMVVVSGVGSLWSNTAALYVGNSGARNQLIITNGGSVFGTSITVGNTASKGNTVRIESGGILDANTLVANFDIGSSNNSITNFGGVFQFSTATPGITQNVARGGGIVLTNGWISFRNVGTVDVKGNWGGSDLTNVIFQGANTFRFNSASNTTSSVQDYTFAPNLGATNYIGLEMINGTTAWRGGSLTIGSGGTLLVSNTSASIQGVLTNSGGITVVNASASYASNVVINGSSSYLSQSGTNAFVGGLAIAVDASVSLDANSTFSALGGSYTSQGGGLTNANGVVSFTSTDGANVAVVSGSGSLWTNTGIFSMASAGNQLIITNGGWVVHTYGYVGVGTGSSNNTVLVSDTNSLWRNYNLRMGDQSAGNRLIITNGGRVAVDNLAYVGYNASSSNNTVLVSGSGSLWTNASTLYVGNSGAGNRLIITDSGRVVNVAGNVGLNSSSSNNVVLVSGSGSLWRNTGSLSVGSSGASNQLIIADGGVVVSAGGNVGNAASASSNMAVVSGVGSLWTNTSALYVGNLSAGNQLIITNGGRVFATSVTVGNAASANGNKVWIESGSLLNANALVMTNGVNNSIVFNGGTLNVKATAVSNGSVFTVGNGTDSAVFNLLGGTNSFANGLLINPNATLLISNINAASSLGTLTNQGLFNIASGNYRPGAGSVAAGSGVLRVGSGGVLDLTNGGFTMGNTLTNAGTVNVMNSHVTYAAPVVISGGYISDPSTNTFKDHVTVTPDGYLIGGLVVSNADQFVFEKDLFMLSTNRLFNVSKAGFLFTNSTSHLLSISNSGALNIGQGYASFSQVASNFAIGTLSIALGDKLTIAGNKDSKTNALYVGWLDIQGLGSPGMLTNTLGDVTNTLLLALSLPNVNLYYDVYDQRNNWLTAQLPSVAGAGYDLWNGGLLLPIPEPSALMLTLVAGALSAFILRRKDRK